MKKFMGLLLVMALLVGAASITPAECTSGNVTFGYQVVPHLWIAADPPATLIFDPCDNATNETRTFYWGYGANGCSTFKLQVTMYPPTYTSTGCGSCINSTAYPDFTLTLLGNSWTFTGCGSPEGESHTFGVLPNKYVCDTDSRNESGTATIVGNEYTCTGAGTVLFKFTIWAYDCNVSS